MNSTAKNRFHFCFSTVSILTLLLCISPKNTFAADPQGHTDNGTSYGETGVQTYTFMKHGPDGALFLDPFFLPYLKDIEGKILLDAGCGAGPWSIFAAKNGAIVCGIDIQEKMIDQAKIDAEAAGIGENITFEVGDVGNMNFPADFFNQAISINVGCNLPSLEKHIQELSRVLKKGSLALITAPTSFGVVFTDGVRANETIIQDIQNVLNDNSNGTLPAKMKEFSEVYRATFAKRDGKWKLVLGDMELITGEEIWRKIPGMVVPNFYHSEKEYLTVFAENGFVLKYKYSPNFGSEEARLEYNSKGNSSLGSSYVHSSPFLIFVIEKL